MYKEKTWLTCREAAILLNYSQRHILNLIKNGKLSADRDDDGKYYIDKSEFYRVYPHAMPIEIPVENDGNDSNSIENSSKQMLEIKIKHLEEMIDEKKKQNHFLTEQISNFTQEKLKMLDAINCHGRLLEFKETSKKDCSHPTPSKYSKLGWKKLFTKE